MVDETLRVFGRMDILVNNAGVSGPSCDFVNIDKKDWGAVTVINVNGPSCQRRSKISPPGRSKTSPLNVMRYAVLGGCPGSP